MTTRHSHHSRVVGRFARIPDALPDGGLHCPACSKVFKAKKRKRIPRHRDNYGDPCPFTASYETVELDEVPSVNVPPRATPPGTSRSSRETRPNGEPSRIDAGSHCQRCGKWLPGERRLCGACFVRSGR